MESPAAQVPAAQRECDIWKGIVRGILQGDDVAEQELVRHFHARVRVMAESRMHGSDAAQDIAQETMMAVLAAVRAGKLREAEKLPAFVLGTARNLVNNLCRKEARIRVQSRTHSAFDGTSSRPANARMSYRPKQGAAPNPY